VYQFHLSILSAPQSDDILPISDLRRRLCADHEIIIIDDLGAIPGRKIRSISDLARRASMPERYGRLLHRLVQHYRPDTIVELGTCLGIGTAYMATGSAEAQVVTIEGSPSLSDLAMRHHSALGLKNIKQVTGSFETMLPEVLAGMPHLGMAFIDGHHLYAPTLRYFEMLMERAGDGTILVLDDIHWSPEMTRAWQAVCRDPRISLTIDLYRMGIAFVLHDKLAKEDFVLRY
jgi:predicted O-methyltransferase YrrM